MPQDFAALRWVTGEIDQTAGELSKSLLGYADNLSDETRLRLALTQAHQLHATLRVVGVPSAVRLGSEIEATVQSLLHGKIPTSEANLQILLAATLQLPGYLHRIAAEQRESPLDVLGVVNELRAARAEEPIPPPAPEELIDLRELQNGLDDGSHPASAEDMQLLRRARTQFQVELLGLLKGEQVDERLQRLQKVFGLLGQRLRRSGQSLFWQAAAAVCDAWDRGGVPFNETARGLMRDLDGEFRNALALDQALYTKAPNSSLYHRMLQLIALSRPVSTLLADIQQRHRLTPESALGASAHAALDDFGATSTVVDVLGSALSQALERLELSDGDAFSIAHVLRELEPELRQVANVLAGLGFAAEHAILKPQLELIRSGVPAGANADELLTGISAALLDVDQRLATRAIAAGGDGTRSESRRHPLVRARVALCREVQAGLEQLKHTVSNYARAPDDVHAFAGSGERLHAMSGALRMAELGTASVVLERCRAYVDGVLRGARARPDPSEIEHFADALSSVEYFVERFAIDQVSSDLLLERAYTALDQLDKGVQDAPEAAAAKPDPQPATVAHSAAFEPEAAAVEAVATEVPDPEIVGIFVDEAAEVLHAIEEQIPLWRLAPETGSSLTEIRRAFHTLKGSGRMVGADGIAELAWSIEHLLNRVLDRSVETTAAVVDVVERTCALMPELVGAFARRENANYPDARDLRDIADALARNERPDTEPQTPRLEAEPEFELEPVLDDETGYDIESAFMGELEFTSEADSITDPDIAATARLGLASEPANIPEFVSTAETDEEAEPLDPEIIAIFVDEAAEVLHAMEQQFPLWRAEPTASGSALAELRRGFHTLKGSGRMVGANGIGDLAWSIERLLNRVLDRTVAATADVVNLVDRARLLMPNLVQAFAGHANADTLAVQELRAAADRSAIPQHPVDAQLTAASETFESQQAARLEATSQTGTAPSRAVPQLFEEWVPELEPEEVALAEESPDDTEIPDEQLLEAELSGAQASVDTVAPAMAVEERDALAPAAADQELREVFAAETAEHLQELREYLAGDSHDASEVLHRALHTLKGAAATAGVVELDSIARPLEEIVELSSRAERSLEPPELAILRDFCDLVEELLHSHMVTSESLRERARELAARCERKLRETLVPPEHVTAVVPEARLARFLEEALEKLFHSTSLLQDWRDGQDERQSRIDLAAELQTIQQRAEQLAVRSVQALSEPLHRIVGVSALGAGSVIPELFDAAREAIEALLDVLDRLAAGQSPEAPVAVVARLEALAVPHQPETAISHAASGEPLPEADREVARARMTRDLAQADPEVLGIFIQEAEDLMMAIDEAIECWRHDRENRIPFDELQRNLHTLKGGARVSGLKYLGDISHNFETFLINQNLHFGSFDDGFFNRVAAFHEQLARALDWIREPAGLPMAAIDGEPVAQSAPAAAAQESAVEAVAADMVAGPGDAPMKPALSRKAFTSVDEMRAAIAVDLAMAETELLGIFLEEADELMSGIDASIAAWRADRTLGAAFEDLLRSLHTLKGGARMAGLAYLGNESHDFESFLNEHGIDRAAEDAFFAQVEEYHEQLQRVMDVVREPPASPAVPTLDQPAVQVEAKAQAAELVLRVEAPPEAAIPVASTSIAPVPAPIAALEPTLPPPPVPAAKPKLLEREEVVRVSAQLLEELVNLAGETSISRGRVEEQVTELGHLFDDMQSAIERVQSQVRRLDIATEAQVLFRRERAESSASEHFDPLEMDRYSQLQQLSRSLVESASDLLDIKRTLAEKTRDLETVLIQQSRINSQLQEGLMRSRMVPFSSILPRLRRIVRQVSNELGKQAELDLGNVAGDLDRGILERVVAPLEHMLRNAVDHGIEPLEKRRTAGKPDTGRILIDIARDGGDVLISVSDDGGGINLEAVRRKAVERGLIPADAVLSDQELVQFILHAGFTTAEKVTQISGRGVGMDVVNSEIRQMGGSLEIHTNPSAGSRFVIRLPFTVSVSRALLVRVGSETLALPLNTVEGVVRLRTHELALYEGPQARLFEYAGQRYGMLYLGSLLYPGDKLDVGKVSDTVPVVLVRGGGQALAVEVDKLLGASEIVVKSLGPQFGAVPGLSGATVLGDGSVVVILDIPAMLRADAVITAGGPQAPVQSAITEKAQRPPVIMVVDDSVTVRKVTTRFLEREGMQVVAAKDGLDAMTRLQEQVPDLMLLDIEMPHMDGFEVLSKVRHNERMRDLPIIMITSRTGEKHRERALSLGANLYLGKPYQESVLLEQINSLLHRSNEPIA